MICQKRFLTNILNLLSLSVIRILLSLKKSFYIHCTDYIDLHRYKLEWKEISSHNQIVFMDFVDETMDPKILYDVDGFFNKVICHINNSLHSEDFFI